MKAEFIQSKFEKESDYKIKGSLEYTYVWQRIVDLKDLVFGINLAN